DAAVTVERAAGWEGGLSVRARPAPALAVVAGVGGRTARDWRGFAVRSGEAVTWSVGTELHDQRDPWTARFGLGEESERGVPAPAPRSSTRGPRSAIPALCYTAAQIAISQSVHSGSPGLEATAPRTLGPSRSAIGRWMREWRNWQTRWT